MHKIYCGQIRTTKGLYRQFRVFSRKKLICNDGSGYGPYFEFFSNKPLRLASKYCGKMPKFITGVIVEIDEHLKVFLDTNYQRVDQTLWKRKGG